MTMIELDGVTRLYGNVIGVNDIHLSLSSGAYGLLGPNGSGKSTLIHLLTGQIRPTQGTVRVFDRNPRSEPQVLRRIGVCPERDLRVPEVTGHSWVTYLVEQYGYSGTDARDRAENALNLVGMEEDMHRPIGTYSNGMRQRTNIAQALVHDPDLLILDEPFNGLDPVGRHRITDYLKSWIEEGKSLLFASHVLEEVEALTTSFLLICNGRLLASGTAEEVRKMLVDIPHEIRIACSEPQVLQKFLLGLDGVSGLRDDGDEAFVVSTSSPLEIYEALPAFVSEHGVDIRELHAPDENLQALFDHLMARHRGEVRG